MSKVKELRDVSEEELLLKSETLRREIYDLRSQRLDSKTQKIHLIGHKKKEIARILTILKEKELKRSV